MIDHMNLLWCDLEIVHDIPLGTFADSDDGISVPARPAIFITVKPTVDGSIILRITDKDQVVYGHDAFRPSLPTDIERQLVAETMIDIHAITFEATGNPEGSPQRFETPPKAFRKTTVDCRATGLKRLKLPALTVLRRIKEVFVFRVKTV